TEDVLQQIIGRSSGLLPTVVFTGYYNPLSASCAATEQRLTSEEFAWVDSRLADLNQALPRIVTSTSFATFVPIDFAGHDLCSPDPWVQDTNSPTPLHPTAAGQQAIAQMILANL